MRGDTDYLAHVVECLFSTAAVGYLLDAHCCKANIRRMQQVIAPAIMSRVTGKHDSDALVVRWKRYICRSRTIRDRNKDSWSLQVRFNNAGHGGAWSYVWSRDERTTRLAPMGSLFTINAVLVWFHC